MSRVEPTIALHILILAAVLLLVVGIHEAGHAVAMRRFGMRPIAAGVGLPLPPVLRLRLSSTFTFTLSPWLLGAYVEPSERDTERIPDLPYRDAAWVYNAGVIVNFVFGFAVTAVAARSTFGTLIYSIAAVAIWALRRLVAGYVLPLLAIPALGITLYGMVLSWSQGQSGVGFAGLVDLVPTDPPRLLSFVGVISIVVGILNLVPVYPLDNARVCDLLLGRWVGPQFLAWFRGVGVALMLLSLVGAVLSDLLAAI